MAPLQDYVSMPYNSHSYSLGFHKKRKKEKETKKRKEKKEKEKGKKGTEKRTWLFWVLAAATEVTRFVKNMPTVKGRTSSP